MSDFNRYLKMLLVIQKVEIIEQAIKRDIFKAIEDNSLNINEHKTKLLLDSLVFMKLLKRKNSSYINSDFAKKYFIKVKSSYCGDIFLHKKMMIENGKMAIQNILDGKKTEINQISNHWANASKLFLKQEQKNVVSTIALDIVKKLKDFKQFKTMLDLGCASGLVGLELTKNHPFLQTTLFDYLEVTNIAKEHIKEYGLENRVKVLSGDIQSDDIGKNYDLIWCSNIFYFLKNKKDVIQKIYNSLNTNGVLISSHVEININNSEDEDSFFYFLALNMQEKDILKPFELSEIFEDVGFRYINSYTNFETLMCQSQIHICRK